MRHKVFVSYHHDNDQKYREKFESICEDRIVSWSVEMGDIDEYLKDETIWQKIRDEYLRESTVTVILIGEKTWQRKFIDWEISASIRDTEKNPRSGLLGILLPTHPDYNNDNYNKCIVPPRFYDNCKCDYAKLYDWSNNPETIQNWIHGAFLRRDSGTPDNSYPRFKGDRRNEGWC